MAVMNLMRIQTSDDIILMKLKIYCLDIANSTEPLEPTQEGKVDFNPSESRAQNFEDDEDGDDSGSISSIDDSDGKAKPSKIRTLRSQVRIVRFLKYIF